jgi:hypothetical protein
MFVELLTFLVGVFGGIFGENSCKVFLLHGTLGSYLRDTLQEGSADTVACLGLFLGLGFFSPFSAFCLVVSAVFFL